MSERLKVILKSMVYLYNQNDEVDLDELCKHSGFTITQVMNTIREAIDSNIIKFSTLREFNFKYTQYVKRGKVFKTVKYFNS